MPPKSINTGRKINHHFEIDGKAKPEGFYHRYRDDKGRKCVKQRMGADTVNEVRCRLGKTVMQRQG